MNKWYPNSTTYLRTLIKGLSYSEESNFVYTIQYLEYINYLLSLKNQTSIIESLLIRDFIIQGMALLEFLYLKVYTSYKPITSKLRNYSFSKVFYEIKKNTYLKYSPSTLEDIEYLHKLRNKIHIGTNNLRSKTDYNTYKRKDFLKMKSILKITLSQVCTKNIDTLKLWD